jgi:hypothetical protein
MVAHQWHIGIDIFAEFELHSTQHDSYRVFLVEQGQVQMG